MEEIDIKALNQEPLFYGEGIRELLTTLEGLENTEPSGKEDKKDERNKKQQGDNLERVEERAQWFFPCSCPSMEK